MPALHTIIYHVDFVNKKKLNCFFNFIILTMWNNLIYILTSYQYYFAPNSYTSL